MQPNNIQPQPMAAPLQTMPPSPQPMPPQSMPTTPSASPTSPAAKKHKISTILAVIFGLTTIALGAFLIFSILNKKPETAVIGDTTVPTSTPLSKIEIPANSAEDILKNALSGRTFTVNADYEEYISFTDSSKYEYSYYRDTPSDRYKLQPSTKTGTYTVKDKTITLNNSETFQITGDYLVKGESKDSNNKTAVYFDSLQLNNVLPNITTALNNYLNTNKKSEMPNYEKIRIDRFYCRADFDNKKITNADSYLCDTTYSYIFDQSKLEEQMKAAKISNFPAYCAANNSPYKIFLAEEGECNNNGTASTWSFVIVRTDNITYRVTGTFRTIEGITDPLPRY